MEALRRKWNSSRGASILLALLFMLICVMAGTSVLMAAASNAGKINSNKEEQQKYLSMSSALQLLASELEGMEYVGQFTYNKVESPTRTENGKEYKDIEEKYAQVQGCFFKPAGSGSKLSPDVLGDILPLLDSADYFFAANIVDKYSYPENRSSVEVGNTVTTTHTTYTTRADDADLAEEYDLENEDALESYKNIILTNYRIRYLGSNGAPCKVKFTVDGAVTGNYGFSESVVITAWIAQDGSIYLDAAFGNNGNSTMRAILKPDIGNLSLDRDDDHYNTNTGYYCTKESIKWKLDEIIKL